MNELGINSLADVRAVLYMGLPVLTALLVSLGVANGVQSALWAGLVTALAGPGLAFWKARSVSNLRSALYAVAVAGQAVAIGYGLLGDAGTWTPVVSAAIAALGGGLAVANTPVTSAFNKGANRGLADPNAPTLE